MTWQDSVTCLATWRSHERKEVVLWRARVNAPCFSSGFEQNMKQMTTIMTKGRLGGAPSCATGLKGGQYYLHDQFFPRCRHLAVPHMALLLPIDNIVPRRTTHTPHSQNLSFCRFVSKRVFLLLIAIRKRNSCQKKNSFFFCPFSFLGLALSRDLSGSIRDVVG